MKPQRYAPPNKSLKQTSGPLVDHAAGSDRLSRCEKRTLYNRSPTSNPQIESMIESVRRAVLDMMGLHLPAISGQILR